MDISAPVGQKDRITKPDPKKKGQKFKPVANKREDVELVQLMLVANGYNVEVDGKCGSGTISAIKAFQKSALGFKTPDGIVDPGEKTWSKGSPKLIAMIKADEKAVQDVVIVKEGGREKCVARDEFEREEKALKHKVMSKADMMLGQAEVWLDFCADAEKSLQGVDGFMASMVEFSVRWANSKAEPPYDPLLDAKSEATILKSMVSRSQVDWTKVQAQDKKATAAYNKGVKAFQKFIDNRIGTASGIVGKLETVRDLSFTVVEAYATAQLMVRKMPPAQAHALAAGGTEALKSSATQLGEYLAGNKVTWESAGKKVLLDSAVATVAGAAGGKLSGGFAKQAHLTLSLKLAPMFQTNVGKKALGLICTKLLDNPAIQGVLTSGAKEAVGLLKVAAETGKPPKEKDIYDAILKSFAGGVASLIPVKTFLGFEANSPQLAKTLIADKLAPAVGNRVKFNLMMKGIDVTDEMMKELSDDVYKKIAEEFTGKATEIMIMGVAEKMTSKESEGGLSKLGEQELRRNADLQKEIEARIEAELRTRIKKAEKRK
jgi:uncharacterized protein YejL (UPF0352 family)